MLYKHSSLEKKQVKEIMKSHPNHPDMYHQDEWMETSDHSCRFILSYIWLIYL